MAVTTDLAAIAPAGDEMSRDPMRRTRRGGRGPDGSGMIIGKDVPGMLALPAALGQSHDR